MPPVFVAVVTAATAFVFGYVGYRIGFARGKSLRRALLRRVNSSLADD